MWVNLVDVQTYFNEFNIILNEQSMLQKDTILFRMK